MGSNIEWTDETWNPVVGCKAVSPGCAHCYAEKMAKRLAAMAEADAAAGKNPGRKAHYQEVIGENGRWNGRAVCVPEALADPLKWKKPRRVFVNSMSDLFHEDVPFDFIDKVFAVMAVADCHTFQVLTKRPDRAVDYLASLSEGYGTGRLMDHAIELSGETDVRCFDSVISGVPDKWSDSPLPNVWIGTSVENQEQADKRIPELLKIPAAVRFLSMEPLLGPVDLQPVIKAGEFKNNQGINCDWVIVGGESGPGARPMHPEWVRSIRDQCQAAGVPFFFKQFGEWMPDDGRVLSMPHTDMTVDGQRWGGIQTNSTRLIRVGKKSAGRTLDGREWSEFPNLVVTGG